MMQLVHCDQCNGTTIGLDSVAVDVNLNKSNACEKCHRTGTQTTHYFFCSEKCFHEYLKKVAEGEAEFKFDRFADCVRHIPIR